MGEDNSSKQKVGAPEKVKIRGSVTMPLGRWGWVVGSSMGRRYWVGKAARETWKDERGFVLYISQPHLSMRGTRAKRGLFKGAIVRTPNKTPDNSNRSVIGSGDGPTGLVRLRKRCIRRRSASCRPRDLSG